MESQFQQTQNGQSIIEADINLLGMGALMDDRVFAELFRMSPYDGVNVSRGVLPYASALSGDAAFVQPNGASGSVLVNPFRALIGSRTAVGTAGLDNWRDIRSTVGVGSTTLTQQVAFGANSSGNNRWDLVYAAVAVNANGASVTRKVKDPTSKVIAAMSVVTTLVTTVALGVVAGTPSASPVWPAAPTDAGGTYYIPLAFIRIPNGFSASSTVLTSDIAEIAPTVSISRAMGIVTAEPTDQSYNVTTTQQQLWAAGTKPITFFPRTMTGGSQIFFAVDLTVPTHVTGDVIDSRDWRNRLCRWQCAIGPGNAIAPFDWSPTGGTPAVTSSLSNPSTALTYGDLQFVAGMGATFGGGNILQINAAGSHTIGFTAAGGDIIIACDSGTGELKINIVGTPGGSYVFWLDFTAPFTP